MKYLFVSDIHGSLPQLEKVLSFFERENYDMLCLGGDMLNYGPRNRLPEGLDAQGVAALLNRYASRIVAVRGNCESEVDQMLLAFPTMADYALIVDEGVRIFLTHGHVYNPKVFPQQVDVLIYGHTHVWQLEQQQGMWVCNMGSPTFPKQEREPTFATLCDGVLAVRAMDGEVLRETSLREG